MTMFVVGLTGGIGSGKSVVTELFQQFGVPIIDADIIARELTKPAHPALAKIIAHFGSSILLPDQTLDRRKLREIVFNQSEERIWLENLLHPLIRDHIKQALLKLHTPYCIVVIPLLVEKNTYPFINRVLVVDSKTALQVERVMQRDQVSAAQAESILKAQITRDTRLKLADDVLINDGSVQDLKPKVLELHEQYLNMSER